MFCNQCEQTPTGGCTIVSECAQSKFMPGVCGKTEDIASLQDIIIYELKGVAAYATHAKQLGYSDPEVDAITYEALYSTLTNTNFNFEETLAMALKVGSATVKIMKLLDKAHTELLGTPVPVTVSEGKIEGHCILITGHNLFALEQLLKQTEGKGVNVYTHSEMLPAHSYPLLKKYAHLKGNVGKSWTDQRYLFEEFPGAILGTTNCVLPIKGTYSDRFWAYEITGLEGVNKIHHDDFTPIIEKALSLTEVNVDSLKTLTTGYHHTSVLQMLPKIVEAIKTEKIKRIFIIAGCDAPGMGGDYYRELALSIPKDCIIMTTACGKFRFNDHDFGTIEGIPRFMDIGQCNNSGSVITILLALADAMECSVNDLPLNIVLSWFEQKAVAILFGLFSLGFQNMYVGPKPPDFVSMGLFHVLHERFDLNLTWKPESDLETFLTKK